MQLALWNEPAVPTKVSRRLASAAGHAPPSLPVPAPIDPLQALQAQAERYLEHAHAHNTRRAYRSDWASFEAWCTERELASLPASEATLELYLTHLAGLGRRASTIRRARIAIGLAHGHAGAQRPDQHPRIRTLERGIGRTHGTREQGALPMLEGELATVVKTLGHTPRDDRDRALLLLCFAGAFRRVELAGLNVQDVTFRPDGLEIHLQRSKEDQLAKGASTRIPFGSSEDTCPVRALSRWLERVGRPTGPLFAALRACHQRLRARRHEARDSAAGPLAKRSLARPLHPHGVCARQEERGGGAALNRNRRTCLSCLSLSARYSPKPTLINTQLPGACPGFDQLTGGVHRCQVPRAGKQLHQVSGRFRNANLRRRTPLWPSTGP